MAKESNWRWNAAIQGVTQSKAPLSAQILSGEWAGYWLVRDSDQIGAGVYAINLVTERWELFHVVSGPGEKGFPFGYDVEPDH